MIVIVNFILISEHVETLHLTVAFDEVRSGLCNTTDPFSAIPHICVQYRVEVKDWMDSPSSTMGPLINYVAQILGLSEYLHPLRNDYFLALMLFKVKATLLNALSNL